jgi:hypothetical protein
MSEKREVKGEMADGKGEKLAFFRILNFYSYSLLTTHNSRLFIAHYFFYLCGCQNKNFNVDK